MTTEFRIDSVQDLESGEFSVAYTTGSSPLPVAPGGLSVSFPSRQAFVEMLEETTDSFPVNAGLAIAMAATFKANPSMPNLAAFRGRFVRLDFDGAVQAIVSG